MKLCYFRAPYVQAIRELLTKLRPSLDEKKLPLLIFVNKGIEVGTHALTLEIIADTCGRDIARAATFIVRHHALIDLYPKNLWGVAPVWTIICRRKYDFNVICPNDSADYIPSCTETAYVSFSSIVFPGRSRKSLRDIPPTLVPLVSRLLVSIIRV